MRLLILLLLHGSIAVLFPQEPALEPTVSEDGILQIPSVPHVRIDTKENCVDVDAEVCLHEGFLELIACRKGTKEHESVVALKAEAKHVHLMLVLLGVKPGHPPRREPIDESGQRYRDVPATGQEVRVSLVFAGPDGESVERPISDFIKGRDEERLPTDRFLFAGSRLHSQEGERPVYVADQTGHLITLSSFGDEVLSYPEVLSHAAADLAWQVDRNGLPEIGSEVILRLRPGS